MGLSNKTIIEIDDKKIKYEKTGKSDLNTDNVFLIFIITFVILLFSMVFTLLINFEWEPLIVLNKFKRIKKNMNSWFSIINEKTGIEINKGRLLYLSKPSSNNFQCMDFGTYIVPGRLSKESFLPEFVKRGNSGPWVITKADNNDPSAEQFCTFLLDKYVTKSNNIDSLITCGTDMFKKLGYGGYFIPNSPCERAIEVLTLKN